MTENNYTHKGWFYFVPVLLKGLDDPFGPQIKARYFGTGFLIHVCVAMHIFVNFIKDTEQPFQFKITGKL